MAVMIMAGGRESLAAAGTAVDSTTNAQVRRRVGKFERAQTDGALCLVIYLPIALGVNIYLIGRYSRTVAGHLRICRTFTY